MRTRRRGWTALFALGVFVCADAVWSIPRLVKDGWSGLVPTWFLVAFAPVGDSSWEVALSPDWRIFSPPKGSLIEIACSRLKETGLSQWQSQFLLGRIIRAHPGEIDHVVQVPRDWPTDVPLRVHLNPDYAHSYCHNGDARVRVRLHNAGRKWTGSRIDEGALNEPDFGLIGPVQSGNDTVRLDVEIGDESGALIWSGVIQPHVRVAGTLTDFMKAVDPDGEGERIKACRPRVVLDENGAAFFAMDDPTVHHGEVPISCTLALAAEILRDGKVVGTSTIFFFNESALYSVSRMFSPAKYTPISWIAAPTIPAADNAPWQLRLRADRSLAMEDFIPLTRQHGRTDNVNKEHANRFWNGELVFPLTVVPAGQDQSPW